MAIFVCFIVVNVHFIDKYGLFWSVIPFRNNLKPMKISIHLKIYLVLVGKINEKNLTLHPL